MDTGGDEISAGIGFFMILVGLVFFVINIWATSEIISKAGYSRWWVLSQFVPVFGLIMFFVFAFSKWPVLERQSWASRYAAQQYQQNQAPAYGQTGYRYDHK